MISFLLFTDSFLGSAGTLSLYRWGCTNLENYNDFFSVMVNSGGACVVTAWGIIHLKRVGRGVEGRQHERCVCCVVSMCESVQLGLLLTIILIID